MTHYLCLCFNLYFFYRMDPKNNPELYKIGVCLRQYMSLSLLKPEDIKAQVLRLESELK